MIRYFAFCTLLGAAAAVHAQGSPVQVICPIDGARFSYVPPPAAGSRELYLDMKPVVPAGSSWPHPKCPENGFVMYKRSFTDQELAKLRDFVRSDQYRSMVESHSSRYLESLLRRHVGDPAYDVAWSLAQATWEVSNDPALYRKYAEEALAAYNALPGGRALPRRQRVVKEMMSGELERRLGLFDAAKHRFSAIRDEAEFTTPVLQSVIRLQLSLINAKDTGIHRMPN